MRVNNQIHRFTYRILKYQPDILFNKITGSFNYELDGIRSNWTFINNGEIDRRPKKETIYNDKGEEIYRLDLRHRLPCQDLNYKVVDAIENEIHCLSSCNINIFEIFKMFFMTYCKKILDFSELQIIDYFEGSISLEEIGINKENAHQYLKLVKLADLTLSWQTKIKRSRLIFKNSSFAIRTLILELLSPDISTTEVYTLSVDPKKLKNIDYLRNPKNWVPERIRFYTNVLIVEFIKAIELSKRLGDTAHVYALRGSTASGKTSMATKLFFQAVGGDGELAGCINPDTMKSRVKKNTSDNISLFNSQVHDEVTKGPLSHYKNGILSLNLNILIDTRLPDFEAFDSIANRKGGVTLIDIDVPLHGSLDRVLALREPTGKDACVLPDPIKEGWEEIRRSRLSIIDRIKQNPTPLVSYELYYTDPKGNIELIAEQKKGCFKVISKELLKESCTLPSLEKIKSEFEKIITPEYRANSLVPPNNQANILRWENFTIGRALESHAKGITVSQTLAGIEAEKILNQQYGIVHIMPFNPTWLAGYPEIQKFLKSEHLLHIRGVDSGGRGLTFRTNTFKWNMNPAFNPEASGGFQMKLGYFIIPFTNVESHKSKFFSAEILESLEVINQKGKRIAYRFFVHPGAYKHFQQLLGKFDFIVPEKSEFMGTPTSSYRSWVIRKVNKSEGEISPLLDSVPFIVKLGVGDLSDTSKLLSEKEIIKSIETQIKFDRMIFKEDLTIFPETFGLIIKNKSNYPPCTFAGQTDAPDSGMIIREFPKEVLKGNCKILSFSALMSMERSKQENHNLCRLTDDEDMGTLPLIYDIIKNAINEKLVESTTEFFEKYIIDGIFQALKPLIFKKGLSLPIHGQNLCIVLNNDNTPRGVALRDYGDIHEVNRYIETGTWFHRYHLLIKLANSFIRTDSDLLPAIPGAPTQMGFDKPHRERSLYFFLKNELHDPKALEVLDMLSITFEEFVNLLKIFDEKYIALLSKYFDLNNAGLDLVPLNLPSAEVGSAGEFLISKMNRKLFEHRRRKNGKKMQPVKAAIS